MEFLSDIVGKVLEQTVKSMGRQLGYLIFYHRNVNQLKHEFEELQARREAVQHLVDVARRNGEEIEAEVQDWFTKVDEITKWVEKLYGEESHAKIECSYNFCLNFSLRHQLSKQAKNMTLEVEEIKRKGKFDKVSFNAPPQWLDLSSTSIEGIESRMSTMNHILEALVYSNVNMIGLWGPGGVGKTTLAKKVAMKAKEEKLFETVVMVNVAQDPVIKEIQREIAEQVGMKFDLENEDLRAGRLNKRLKQEKKLLIVLDDLWERLDLKLVGIPFDFDDKRKNSLDDENDEHYTSCKILLTSRNVEILCNQMECKRIIKVDILSKKEAWELFKEEGKLHGAANDPYLLPVANEVAERCGQLPLAIVIAARALRNKGLSEWRDFLQRLKKPLRRDLTGIKEVHSSLKMSYDCLSQELKYIFLLSAMLPPNSLVSDLLVYSVGLSLLQDVHSIEKARDGLDALVNKLKGLNLLLDSFSRNHFTMHDVVRDVALSIASKEQLALVVRNEKQYELPEKNLLEDCTRLCLDKCDITELPEELYCPRLEFFLLGNKNPNLRIPSMFFNSTQELKVLDFTDMYFSSLPSSLCLLEKVKTLCLYNCKLEDIAEVGKLKNLKVLNLVGSVIKRLPLELGRLTYLQMLDLTNCYMLEVIPRNLLSSLKRLEVLNMTNSFNQWEAEGSGKGDDNASLIELMHLSNLSSLEICIPNAFALPKDLFLENSLNRYRIFIGTHWERPIKYGISKTLELKLESSIHLKPGVQKLLESVENLWLDKLSGINNVLYDLDRRGFPNLKHLCIQNNDQIEYIISSTGLVDAFPNLETLNLLNLNGLKKLCQGRITVTSFQKLRVIKVSGCNQLKVLFSKSMVGLFGSLVEIDISGCESIKEIVVSTNKNTFKENLAATDVIIFHQLCSLKMVNLPTLTDFFFDENATNNGDSQIFESFFNNKVSFPNLEILNIFKVNIQYIWNDQFLHNSFSHLKTLVVENCHFLVKLIPLHLQKCLSNLEELKVTDCNLLEMVFDFEELESTNKELHSLLPVTLKKIELRSLPKLKHVWSNDAKVSFLNLEILKKSEVNIIWNEQFLHNSFSNLKTLLVEHCHLLVKLIPLHILICLSNLEELEVRYCNSLEMVFDFEELKNTDKEIHSLLVVPLKKLMLKKLPKLKHVWSNDSKGIVSFQSLRHVIADECESLTSVFPSSIAKNLLHLEELSIGVSGIEVIVAKDEVLESVATFVFPELTSLVLEALANMKNFYPDTYSLECPRLQVLFIVDCGKLEIFQKEISSSSRLQEEEAHHTKYPLFFQEKQIPNVEKLTLDRRHAMMIWNGQFPAYLFHKVRALFLYELSDMAATFPYGLLKRFPNLEDLCVWDSSIQEILSCVETLGDDAGQIAPVRKLTFLSLKKLKHIWNEHSQMDLFFQNLESLNVTGCSALINLGPSFISLKNLTHLIVNECGGLLYLLTSSTARSLVQLTRLDIGFCGQIEQIITKQREDMEKEIVFKKLKHLRLCRLPRLKSFCSHNYTIMFPLLNKVTICLCPDLIMFSPGVIETPSLEGVNDLFNIEKHWEGNLNKTIQLPNEEKDRKNE